MIQSLSTGMLWETFCCRSSYYRCCHDCIVICRGFEIEDGKASVLLNTAVYGDVTIIVYHARSAFGGKVQGKVCGAIIYSVCFKVTDFHPANQVHVLLSTVESLMASGKAKVHQCSRKSQFYYVCTSNSQTKDRVTLNLIFITQVTSLREYS